MYSWFIPLNLAHPISVSSSCQSFLTFLPDILCTRKPGLLDKGTQYDESFHIANYQKQIQVGALAYFLSLIFISFKKHLKH
jgi:hypothetical protein